MEYQQHDKPHLKTTLLTLPTELLQYISVLSGTSGLCNLKVACRTLNNRLPTVPNTITTTHDSEDPNGVVTQYDLWACYECLRIKAANRFSDNNRKSHRRRGATACETRFCLDCGMNYPSPNYPKDGVRYPLGTSFRINHMPHVVCAQCTKLKPGSDHNQGCRSRCDECWARMPEAYDLTTGDYTPEYLAYMKVFHTEMDRARAEEDERFRVDLDRAREDWEGLVVRDV